MSSSPTARAGPVRWPPASAGRHRRQATAARTPAAPTPAAPAPDGDEPVVGYSRTGGLGASCAEPARGPQRHRPGTSSTTSHEAVQRCAADASAAGAADPRRTARPSPSAATSPCWPRPARRPGRAPAPRDHQLSRVAADPGPSAGPGGGGRARRRGRAAASGLMYVADIVLAAEGTRFATGFAGLGAVRRRRRHLVPAAPGRPAAGPRSCTSASASWTRTRQLDWGLITRLVPAADLAGRSRAASRQLAAGPTRAFGEIRTLLRRLAGRPAWAISCWPRPARYAGPPGPGTRRTPSRASWPSPGTDFQGW